MKNKSIINSYRLQPGASTAPNTPARVTPTSPTWQLRRALAMFAAVLLPVLAGGAVWYGLAHATVAPVVTPTAAPSPVVIERVVQVEAAPVIVIVTPTAPPQPERVVAPARPVQAQPAAPVQRPAPQPTPQPTRLPARAAAVAPSPTWTVAPVQQRAITRGCEYKRVTYPQGTVIQGYYTDANGQPRNAVCRVDGWKDVE